MRQKASLFCILLCISVSLYGQSDSYKNESGFKSDNDSYLALGLDGYYTNGLFITFRHAADQSSLQGKTNKKIWEAEAGQQMYTSKHAEKGTIPDMSYVDRPFVGYLYAGGSLNWLYKSENTLKLKFQAGIMGPTAGGKETQKFLHRIGGFYEIDGWKYQLSNSVGINSGVEFTNFLYRNHSKKVDFSTMSYINAGTTFMGAGFGILFRTGSLNPLFHSAMTNSRISNNSEEELSAKREFFFFAKPVINFIAYDATIQGGLSAKYRGPVTYDVKPIVFSQEIGVMYAMKRWTTGFSVIFKSKEVKSKAKAHEYGSINLYYRFN